MEEENIDAKIKIEGLIKGLILGFILLALSILSFYFIINITRSTVAILVGPFFFSILIPLVLAIYLSILLKKNIGGFWSFKQAVTGIFIMFLACYAVQIIGRDVIFARFIEPDMTQKTENAMVNATTSMYQKNGLKQADVDQKVTDLKKQFEQQKSAGLASIVQSYIIGIILLFVLALIFAAFLKNEQPVIADDTYEEAS